MNENYFYLPHSTKCFVCGIENEKGLKHVFYADNDAVYCDVFIPDGFNGFKDIAHGGIVTALIDETMGWSAYLFTDAKNFLFTRQLQVKFKKSVHIEKDYRIICKVIKVKKPIVYAYGKLVDENETLFIEAEGTFVEIPDNKMKETAPYMLFDKDKKYHPKIVNRLNELKNS